MASARPDTWMPWYIGDYLRDTMHLDAEQDGAYRRLIDACWIRSGVLPSDDAQLAMITKLGPKRWKAVKNVVASFFQVSEDGWRHKRVTEELRKADANLRARSAGGKKAAEKKWSEARAHGSRIADAQIRQRPASANAPLSDAPSPSPYSDPNGSAPGGARIIDPVKALFDIGVEILTASGRSDRDARSLIGRWRKSLGDQELSDLLASAARKTEPVAWLSAAVRDAERRKASPHGPAML